MTDSPPASGVGLREESILQSKLLSFVKVSSRSAFALSVINHFIASPPLVKCAASLGPTLASQKRVGSGSVDDTVSCISVPTWYAKRNGGGNQSFLQPSGRQARNRRH